MLKLLSFNAGCCETLKLLNKTIMLQFLLSVVNNNHDIILKLIKILNLVDILMKPKKY